MRFIRMAVLLVVRAVQAAVVLAVRVVAVVSARVQQMWYLRCHTTYSLLVSVEVDLLVPGFPHPQLYPSDCPDEAVELIR